MVVIFACSRPSRSSPFHASISKVFASGSEVRGVQTSGAAQTWLRAHAQAEVVTHGLELLPSLAAWPTWSLSIRYTRKRNESRGDESSVKTIHFPALLHV